MGPNLQETFKIWSHLLRKSVMDNFIFCAVIVKQLQENTDLFHVEIFYEDLGRNELKTGKATSFKK